MNWLKHFQKYQTSYMIGAFGFLWFINAVTLATSRIMEEIAKETESLPFELWEPFSWEFSSAIMILTLIPLIDRLLQSTLLSWLKPFKSILIVLFSSLIFSLIHVLGMVAIREFVYWSVGSNYKFGNIWFGLLYEYRKDFVTFILIIGAIQAYRFIESRLRGEASLLEYDNKTSPTIDRILVKKLGREFIVKVDNIDWMESSGNYVNLHVGERTYPVRNTMNALIPTLEAQGYCRIHRSFAVKLNQIESIENLDNGGAKLVLVTGKELSVSRRYRDELRSRLDI